MYLLWTVLRPSKPKIILHAVTNKNIARIIISPAATAALAPKLKVFVNADYIQERGQLFLLSAGDSAKQNSIYERGET